MDYTWVGKSVPRIDARPKVTGQAIYINDMVLPGMLIGKILPSPWAHARILRVDTSQAKKLPGVKAVITSADLPDTRVGVFIKDMPVMARNKVRFRGEPVAAVAAADEFVAEEALELIRLEGEELPPVFSAEEAMEPGAPLIHEEVEKYFAGFPARKYGNVATHTTFSWGNLEQGFKEADQIFEEEYSTGLVHQGYIETTGAVATADGAGKITAWASTQSPHLCRMRVAEGLLLPESKIRIISVPPGGAFGGKEDLFFISIAASLAQRAGRPVKIILSRQEEFFMMRPRHAAKIRVKSGVRRDGALTARKVEVVLNTGAYSDQGPGVCGSATSRAGGPYRVPHFQADGYCVYTNQPISGAYRGYGAPQVSFAVESHMDVIAEALGMDPLELRLKNCLETGDPRWDGRPYTSAGLKDCLIKVAKASRWHYPEPAKDNRGKGVAVVQHISGTLTSGALVRINQDGTATVCTGSVDLGTGSATILAQMAAEELGLPLEDLEVVMGDTDATPYDWSTSASRTTFVSGHAVKAASADAKSQLFNLAASELEANPQDLESQNRRIFVKGSPEKGLTFRQLGSISHWRKGGPIIGRGTYVVEQATLDPEKVKGLAMRGFAAPNFGAQGVEVKVEEETGLIQVTHLWAAYDCGTPINPVNVEGQIEGAFAQGLGYALFEKMHLEAGKVLNPNLADYKLPTALDVPGQEVVLVDVHDPTGPFGAKAVGEGGLVPTAAAIANALYRACGVRLRELPLSPEAVLKALKARQ